MNKTVIIGGIAGVLMITAPVVPSTSPFVSAVATPVYDTQDGQLHNGDCYLSGDAKFYIIQSRVPTTTIVTASGTIQVSAQTNYSTASTSPSPNCTVRNQVSTAYTATYSDGTQAYTRTLTQAQYVSLGGKNTTPVTDQTTQSLLNVITGL